MILIQVTSMSRVGVGLRIFRKRDNDNVFVQFLKQESTKFPADQALSQKCRLHNR
jgi:hypothetical protein